MATPAQRGFAVTSSPERVLSEARLEAVASAVFRLREHWVERSPGFHTLGLSLYKDGREAGGAPLDVEANNAMLREAFGPALDDLEAYLRSELDGPVEWGDGLPLPGFHIFEASALRPGEAAGDLHFDIQYVWGGFDDPVLDVASVTVPVRVPAAGTSLEYWPVDYAEYEELYEAGQVADVAELEARFPMQSVPYEPGHACLMRGLPLHRIGTTPSVQPTDHRITLQGHAVRLGDRWIAYW